MHMANQVRILGGRGEISAPPPLVLNPGVSEAKLGPVFVISNQCKRLLAA